MAVRSRDFVGVAEGIRSHELSTRNQIENLKRNITELSGRRSSLDNTISYLEAAIAAAYEDTDEDGDPDYGLIASLEAEKNSAEDELSEVEYDLDSNASELENKQNELESVEEKKQQTLFEIQERARKTSSNISLAGGMFGAYAGVGGSLQNSLQTSLSSLTQAASILGGSVYGVSGGNHGGSLSGAGSSASGVTGGRSGDAETSALTAFTGGYSGEVSPFLTSQFNTNQDHLSTPATMPNYHSGQRSINPKTFATFSSEQGSNNYAVNSFATQEIEHPSILPNAYISSQVSSSAQCAFMSTNFQPPTDKEIQNKIFAKKMLTEENGDTPVRQESFADKFNREYYSTISEKIASATSMGELLNTIRTEQLAKNCYLGDLDLKTAKSFVQTVYLALKKVAYEALLEPCRLLVLHLQLFLKLEKV